jgi:hypothetical protein
MPANNTIDLSRLALSPGQGRRLDLELEPEPLELGGERYTFSPRGRASTFRGQPRGTRSG